MTVRPCWTCAQPATHTLTREGSTALHACDNCTRIDRAEAESRGWTIAPISAAMETQPPKLTPTQERALQQIRSKGEEFAYNGISRATITVLERHGLVTVKWSVRTWTARRTYRNRSMCDWVARPMKGA